MFIEQGKLWKLGEFRIIGTILEQAIKDGFGTIRKWY